MKKLPNDFFFKTLKKLKMFSFQDFLDISITQFYTSGPNSNLIISWNKYQPKFTKHLIMTSKVNLPKIDEIELENFLKKYNLKNFIGLNSRNNLYVSKLKYKDYNYHDYRNFEFKDFDKSINYLKSNNYQIVKLGQTFLEEKYNFRENEILTSQDFKEDKKIDF